jgi:hypothetical protein
MSINETEIDLSIVTKISHDLIIKHLCQNEVDF